MGAISGLMGMAGGVNGTGLSGPSSAGINSPVAAGQIQSAYNTVQNNMGGQNALLAALQGQNGLQNQSNVYGQLQGIANGTGPNPAQAMLNQQTGQNVANQAALMAGQRGSSQNVGLMARQAAQQGAATQQQAVGQGASMQAQQSLNALSGMGSMANTQASNQIGQTNANTQAAQALQQALINAQTGYNSQQVGMQSNINNIYGQLANTTMQGQQAMMGGLMNSIGGGLSSFLADGGSVQSSSPISTPQSSFGQFINSVQAGSAPDTNTPSFGSDAGAAPLEQGAASMGKVGSGSGSGSPGEMPGLTTTGDLGADTATSGGMFGAGAGDALGGGSGLLGDAGLLALAAAKGGNVPAMVSPGEQYLNPNDVEKVKHGANPLRVGEKIPGKPKFPGNDYRNDIVQKNLEEGGIVIPNSVMQSKNPEKDAKAFLLKELKKRKCS